MEQDSLITNAESTSSFRTRSDGWTLWQHALLCVFYVTTILGILSFIAFDTIMLASISERMWYDERDWLVAMFIGFAVSLQFGWLNAAWRIHVHQNPLKPVAVALIPLLFTSLPFGAFAWSEFTKVPPQPVSVVI